MPESQPHRSELRPPSTDTLTAYLDTTKWTTAAVAGTVVFGLDSIDTGTSSTAFALFTVGGVALLVAAFMGGGATLWTVRYMALAERAAERPGGTPDTDDPALRDARRRVSVLHLGHCWASGVGLIMIAIVVWMSKWSDVCG